MTVDHGKEVLFPLGEMDLKQMLSRICEVLWIKVST